jgi:ATP-binding cassette subfamily A (ABC1) protein 3
MKIYVDRRNNDAEIYVLPFQHAIDMAIVNEITNTTSAYGNATKAIIESKFKQIVNSTDDSSNFTKGSIPSNVNEYPYTNQNSQQRADDIRRLFMIAVENFLGIVFFLSLVRTGPCLNHVLLHL